VAGAGALLSRGRLAALGLLGAYAAVVGRAHADAARDPSPARLQRAVGAGILGLMPLEAGLLAGRGALMPAAGVASLWPLARRAAKKRAVT
jgi:4-hydroxybenzoate polyprenyltransferase